MPPMMPPPPMLIFDNLVKKTRQAITVNQLQTKITWEGVMGGIRCPAHDTPMLFFDNLVTP